MRRSGPTTFSSCTRKRQRAENRARALHKDAAGEDAFFLPGKIHISQVRRLQEIEQTATGRALLVRFMVRGYWRRANAAWTDQRLRWIEPYWKGPDMAAIIEREYSLRP